MASTSIRRAETDPTNANATTATFSVWFKRSKIGSYQTIYNHRYTNSYEFKFMMYNDDRLYVICTKSSTAMEFLTTRKFRDTNAWYHLVIALDSTQATNTNRVKIYVNGVQETAFDTATYPSQNETLNLDGGGGYYNNIGSRGDGSSEYWDGSMSYFAKIDGTQELPTIFGETDSTTGEWKIKTTITPSSSWGNKPFFILKDGNSLTDQSGQSKDFSTYQGTLTKTEDNPSNVFATMNPLSKGSDISLSNGNTVVTNTQTSDQSIVGTIACGNGKYYWEAKCTSNTSNYSNIGISLSSAYGGNHSQVDAGRIMWSSNGSLYREGLGLTSVSLGALGTNDIIGVALDTENGTLKFYKGGVLIHTETNNSFLYSNNEYIPASGLRDGGGWNYNFGNGYFGSTQISSAGTNASGIGIFEYDVPTGYTSLSTKGLNL